MASIHYGRVIASDGSSKAVAVKRLHRRHAEDDEFVSMFLDEARVAAQVRHPNVIATLDVVSSSGELLIVMEYVEGETLARLIGAARGSGHHMPFRVAATVAGQLLRGLHAAHEACGEGGQRLNLVHRDISPQNVLVGTDGVARVLDFGVAKAATHVQTTQRGKIKGKLGYMAPEQLLGESCDRRADIFAAGIVLWESLTGRRLFRGSDIAEVVHKVTEADVPPPSAVAASIPVELEAVVMRALERSPADRFASAKEFADALEAVIEPASVADVIDWVTTMGRERLRKRATLIASLEARADRAPQRSFPFRAPSRVSGSVAALDSRPRQALPPPPSAADTRIRGAPSVPRAPRMPSGPDMAERPVLRRSLRAAIVVGVSLALVSAGILAGLSLARTSTASLVTPQGATDAAGFSAPAITPSAGQPIQPQRIQTPDPAYPKPSNGPP